MEQTINEIYETLKSGFEQKANATYNQRMYHISLLKKILVDHESDFAEALQKDFNKPPFETFLTEIFPVLDEIHHFERNLKSYMDPERVGTPLPLLPASGKIYYEPKGIVFIIGAWNYPLTLTLVPLVGALAGGNTILLKPSEISSHSAHLIYNLVNQYFPKNVLQVVEGDGPFTSEILNFKFNHIFYTGSTQVGKIIYRKAAEQLTPVTLELGGKSPAIFDTTADFKKGVKRLIWGKLLNGGQTCVAPDYVLVPKSKKEIFLQECRASIQALKISETSDHCHIVNSNHFKRITSLMVGNQEVHIGGKTDASINFIEPTVIEIFDIEHPLMSQEIFGPVLPVYFYESKSEIRTFYEVSPDPLAFYIFSTNKNFTQELIENFPSGGVVINDVIMHLANVNLPFGGRGTSGIGNYHGIHSFMTFTHPKSILKQVNWIDPTFRYGPYSSKKLSFLRRLIRFVHWV